MSVAVILGSAFDPRAVPVDELLPVELSTNFGSATLHRWPGVREDEAWVAFRHGLPHRLLPHQVDYRAQAAALAAVGCEALLVTSSVGVLDAALPLDAPLLVSDLLMLDNRLPDGSPCTIFTEPRPGQGHLVIEEGLCSSALCEQVERLAEQRGWPRLERVLFGFAMGPRTKTAAENALLARLGAQVNSMTLAPEVVLANELEIPVAALVVGHKYSIPGHAGRLDDQGTRRSLEKSADVLGPLVRDFLAGAEPVPFANRLHRFDRRA